MSMIRVLALALIVSFTAASAAEVLGAVRAVDQNLDKPVCITWAPGDTSRMFVIEQHAGRIRIVKDGALLPTPFLTIAGVANHQEQGLLSMAFHPDYQTNGHFYIHYSDAAGDNVIARYTRLDAERADPNSARQLLWLDHPNGSDVHYGSFLGFNPRDVADPVKKHWLYMTVGDGGGGNYPSGQNPTTLFGKILRVDVDPARFGGAGQAAYGIPSGNTPITAGALPEIIAMGVRNPWRGSFDRTTGDFWFGDIGDTTYEEVNRIPYNTLHLNFQWPAKEGSFVHNNPPATIGVITEPVHFFNRGAVIGGVVYRGNELPGWRGRFLFADYGSNTVRCFTFTGNGTTEHRTDIMTELAAKIQFGLTRIVAFGEDHNGELYFAEHMRGGTNSGMIYRIRQDTDATPPTITSTPTTRATVGFAYTYQVTATGNPAATFSLTAAPSGMTITSGGLLTWTPTQGQIGTHPVSVRAANGTLPNAAQTFDLTVSGQRAADHPLSTTALVGGLEYGYYEGVWADIPAFAGLTPTRTGTVAQPDLSPTHRANDYAFRYTGYVKAEVAGLYAFSTTSDDGSMLYIGDDLVVDNHGPHGAVTVNGTIGLAAGWHRITVQYHQLGGGAVMGAGWTPPGGSAVTIPAAAFARLATPYGLDGYGGATPYLNMPRTITGALPATLSATGTFANTAALQPAAALIPYDVNTPLWSDAADKARWIAIPTGSRLGFDATGNWTFPPGTVLVKHFGFSNGRRLETRLLVVTDNGTAYGVTYKWRADNSDADLLPGNEPLAETVNGPNGAQTWTYPSRANCLQCHTSAAGFVLGVRTRQLNRTITYPSTGRSDNQLRTLGGLGLLTAGYSEGSLTSYHKLSALGDTSASLEQRVRSYLDANCMNCHQPGGGAVAQFDARYTTPLANQGLVDGAVNNTLGIANAKVVAPGDLSRSILYQRMHTTDPAIRMPTLGRSVIDQSATAVVAQWIQGLSGGTNAAPVIVLGAAPSPVAGTAATLTATVTDDGLPTGSTVTRTWSKQSGPGTVTFAAPGSATTGATFSLAGTYVVRLSASDTQLTTTADLTVVVNAPPNGGQVVAAIDCGSTTSYTASNGTVYQADAYFSGGAVAGRGDPISGTPDQALYRNERLGNFSYAIPVPSAGTYDVILQVTEVWWNAAGVRLFDVTAEGQTVVTNFDIYAAAGGKFVAHDRRISVTVNDGTLNLGFITRVDNAMVSAIRVERTGAQPVNTAPQVVMAAAPTAVAGIPATVSASVSDDGLPTGSAVTLAWTQVSGPASASIATPAAASTGVTFPVAGSYVLRLTASDGALSTSGTVTVVAAPPSTGGQVVVAIDSGSTTAYTAADGTVYQADQWFTASATTGRGEPVTGTVDQPLYQNERFGTFSYAIPVPEPGTYDVVLSFAEVWWTAPGMRVFDVVAEGQPAITGLDVFAVTGARYQALDRRISVTVTGATLDLDFITRADNALVSAIRVERSGTPPPPPDVEYRVDFGPTGAAPMSGWLSDTGAVFGDRGNGASYGWNVVTNDTRIRNSAASPDRMHDTLNHLARGTVKTWEIAVPNGVYEIVISAGDPSFADQVNHLVVEGVAVRDADGADNFDELSATVTVGDGRLTITQAADGVNAKLCGVHLIRVPSSSN